jgi:hypothetical protein
MSALPCGKEYTRAAANMTRCACAELEALRAQQLVGCSQWCWRWLGCQCGMGGWSGRWMTEEGGCLGAGSSKRGMQGVQNGNTSELLV